MGSDDDQPHAAGAGGDSEWEEMVLEYARQLPERVEALARAMATARESGSPEAVIQPRRLAHRLYGTAGSYGLEAFSSTASRIEDALLAAGSEGGIGAAAWEQLERDLGALRELAESAGRGVSGAGDQVSPAD